MLNVLEIYKIISDYDKLYEHAKKIINTISELDNKYFISKRIESISFDNVYVNVTCDDSSMGCYDSISFQFPIVWLTIDNIEELKVLVINDKIARETEERKAFEARQIELQKISEDYQYNQYLTLKAKFEPKIGHQY